MTPGGWRLSKWVWEDAKLYPISGYTVLQGGRSNVCFCYPLSCFQEVWPSHTQSFTSMLGRGCCVHARRMDPPKWWVSCCMIFRTHQQRYQFKTRQIYGRLVYCSKAECICLYMNPWHEPLFFSHGLVMEKLSAKGSELAMVHARAYTFSL